MKIYISEAVIQIIRSTQNFTDDEVKLYVLNTFQNIRVNRTSKGKSLDGGSAVRVLKGTKFKLRFKMETDECFVYLLCNEYLEVEGVAETINEIVSKEFEVLLIEDAEEVGPIVCKASKEQVLK